MSKQTGSRHSPTGLTTTPQLASPPTPLQGERGVKCLVGAWLLCLFGFVIALLLLLFPLVVALHILLFSFVVALHITPLSPWRGVGGEALYKTGATQYRPPHPICYAYKCPRRDAISASIASHLASITIARKLIASSAFRSHSVQSSTIVPRYG